MLPEFGVIAILGGKLLTNFVSLSCNRSSGLSGYILFCFYFKEINAIAMISTLTG